MVGAAGVTFGIWVSGFGAVELDLRLDLGVCVEEFGGGLEGCFAEGDEGGEGVLVAAFLEEPAGGLGDGPYETGFWSVWCAVSFHNENYLSKAIVGMMTEATS